MRDGGSVTALSKYQTLEAEARYVEAAGAAARGIILCFGSRTLMLRAPDDTILGHWPLGGIRALGDDDRGSKEGLVLVPDLESAERLYLDDSAMIAAIRSVCPDLEVQPDMPITPKRRRLPVVLGAAALIAVLLVAFSPMLAWYAARLVPELRENMLGEKLVEDFRRRAAPPNTAALQMCTDDEGTAALAALMDRIGADASDLQVRVVDLDDPNLVLLPGGKVLLSRGLIDTAPSAEHLAGIMAHTLAHHRRGDPLRMATRAMGLIDTGRLILTEAITDNMINASAGALFDSPHSGEAAVMEDAYAILGDATLPAQPFDWHRKTASAGSIMPHAHRHDLLAAQPPDALLKIAASTFEPALDDRSWIALSNICVRTQAF